MGRLEDKVALITGAGSGIGRATSMMYAAEGAAVMCADLDEAAAQDTAAQIAERGGKSAALAVDVSADAEVEQAISETIDQLGGFEILFNNAGIGGGAGWERTLAVNLSSTASSTVRACWRSEAVARSSTPPRSPACWASSVLRLRKTTCRMAPRQRRT